MKPDLWISAGLCKAGGSSPYTLPPPNYARPTPELEAGPQPKHDSILADGHARG